LRGEKHTGKKDKRVMQKSILGLFGKEKGVKVSKTTSALMTRTKKRRTLAEE